MCHGRSREQQRLGLTKLSEFDNLSYDCAVRAGQYPRDGQRAYEGSRSPCPITGLRCTLKCVGRIVRRRANQQEDQRAIRLKIMGLSDRRSFRRLVATR